MDMKALTEARKKSEEPGACQFCWGSGKVTDGDDPEPWPIWAALRGPASAAVTLGIVYPVNCPKCEGTGKEH